MKKNKLGVLIYEDTSFVNGINWNKNSIRKDNIGGKEIDILYKHYRRCINKNFFGFILTITNK